MKDCSEQAVGCLVFIFIFEKYLEVSCGCLGVILVAICMYLRDNLEILQKGLKGVKRL